MLKFIVMPFFSEDDGGGGGETTNPLRDEPVVDPIETEVEPDVKPDVEPEEVEEIDFGGRKVKVVDPTIKDLHSDFTELTGTLTREQQQRKQLEEELQGLRSELESLKQPNLSNEDRLRDISEKYAEMAYDDPVQAMIWLHQQPEYQQALKPIQEQSVQSVIAETQKRQAQINETILSHMNELSLQYPDFQNTVHEMDAVIAQYPHLGEQINSNPTKELLESIYYIAKGRQPVSRSPEELLRDESFVQTIKQNEDIKKEIIKEYLDQVNSNQQVPPVVPSSSHTPATPDQTIDTVRDGTNAFKAMLRKAGL